MPRTLGMVRGMVWVVPFVDCAPVGLVNVKG